MPISLSAASSNAQLQQQAREAFSEPQILGLTSTFAPAPAYLLLVERVIKNFYGCPIFVLPPVEMSFDHLSTSTNKGNQAIFLFFFFLCDFEIDWVIGGLFAFTPAPPALAPDCLYVHLGSVVGMLIGRPAPSAS